MEDRLRGAGLMRLLRTFGFALLCTLAGLAHAADNPRVKLDTSLGAVVVELDADKAPKSVANFLAYVDAGFYDGTIFHRVIRGFVAQGGGYDKDMGNKATRAPIPNEAKNGLTNATGTIAMARTNDPNSATSQFYINLADNARLDYPSFDGFGYAVFGKVVEGMDVVRRIGSVKTGDRGGQQDVPLAPVLIKSAKRVAATPGK